jgi:thiosulfate reductase cytochrome b subunit
MFRLQQKIPVRLFHALNLISVLAMVGSGLQIYMANPVFGGRGGFFLPIGLGGWLAGGRHFHFFFMWVFALNLLWYGVYLLVSGHWRRRYASYQDLKALQQSHNSQRRNYAWHRLTLVGMIGTLLLSLYTGLGMYKPVQWSWIVDSVGGDWQALRIAHFVPVVLMTLLVLQHIQKVLHIGQMPLLQSIFVDAYRPKRPSTAPTGANTSNPETPTHD